MHGNCNLCHCAHAGGIAYTGAHFGAGSGPIFLDDVHCTSSSDQLLECFSRPILSHNCHHFSDAGVGCEGVLLYKFLPISIIINKAPLGCDAICYISDKLKCSSFTSAPGPVRLCCLNGRTGSCMRNRIALAVLQYAG